MNEKLLCKQLQYYKNEHENVRSSQRLFPVF